MGRVDGVGEAGNSLMLWGGGWESNRRPRLCRPLHNHSATPPGVPDRERGPAKRDKHKLKGRAVRRLSLDESGAGKESRTPDLNLGKVALYQLSYSRRTALNYIANPRIVKARRRLQR